jgi:2-polyprenyl-3-methyl-5-hydroxy-6-metoxy-1,4-benzoquinol methylase
MITNPINNFCLNKRVSYIQDFCRNKKVLHLGATDAPGTIDAVKNNRLLHSQISEVAESLVGLDINTKMIVWLAQNQNIENIKYGNIENPQDYPEDNFDIILAGEIMEHLSNPGKALDAIRKNMHSETKLIVTVPNAYSLKGFIRAVTGYELIHPDHTLHHSPYTLKSLLERHGFVIESQFSYVNGGKGLAASITNTFLGVFPQLAEGIGVVCKPKINQ